MNIFEKDLLAPEIEARSMTTAELLKLGMEELAYVKPIELDGDMAFAIHAADGSPMAVAPNRDLAVAAILQHEMAAALVH